MKISTLTLLAVFLLSFSTQSSAQTLTFTNNYTCPLFFYATAADGCDILQTNTISIPAGAKVILNMSDPSIWINGIAPASSTWVWAFVRTWAQNGPYLGGLNCSTNMNTCAVGTSTCAGSFPNYNCTILVNNPCGTDYEATWTPVGISDVDVDIF